MYYAYLITNNVNQKVYVGISKDPTNRWQRHRSNARSTSDKPRYNTYLYNSRRKYGTKNFTFRYYPFFFLYLVSHISMLLRRYNIRDITLHRYKIMKKY